MHKKTTFCLQIIVHKSFKVQFCLYSKEFLRTAYIDYNLFILPN